jgi:hypothetical protein
MMKIKTPGLTAAVLFTFSILTSAAEPAFVFRNTTREAGLLPEIGGIYGHAAGWGDVDGDGWIDLYVGTFYKASSKPNMLFRNRAGKFTLDDQAALRFPARSNSGLFADFDNDGDLDLYVASMPQKPGKKPMPADELPRGCQLFRNDGAGKYTNISTDNGACPLEFGGRSATALDYDGDGLLDLLVGEDPLPGYNGSPTKSSRLFRNLGKLQFEDVTAAAGIPAGIPGLGVLAADLNNDGWPDIFLAAQNGGNVLLLNDGHGKFVEEPDSRETFLWPDAKGDNMVCGVCCGDVNRDGLVDLVLGQHFETPWLKPVRNRLYLQQARAAGDTSKPRFVDVSEAAGLVPLPMKSPHIELNDFDNDGQLDLSTSMIKFDGDTPRPVIFRGKPSKDGMPVFEVTGLDANDFPNDEDRKTTRTVTFFDKMLKDKKVFYAAPGPSGDYDRDGKLDFFLASWWPEADSLLLHNETPGGHWLDVALDCNGDPNIQPSGLGGTNRQGIGSMVRIYTAGKLGDHKELIGSAEIMLGYGYVSSHSADAHFGLGTAEKVDIEVTLPHGRGKLTRTDVKADQRLVIQQKSRNQNPE